MVEGGAAAGGRTKKEGTLKNKRRLFYISCRRQLTPSGIAALATHPWTGVGKECSGAVPFSSINLPTPALGGGGTTSVVEGGAAAGGRTKKEGTLKNKRRLFYISCRRQLTPSGSLRSPPTPGQGWAGDVVAQFLFPP